MPEFKSWLSYHEFERKTKRTCRYIFDQSVQEFLNTVLATSKNRYREVPQGTNFWRSQLGNGWRPIVQEKEHLGDEPCPLPSERMQPLPHMANEGRANPKGIPYLYVATDKDTAMAEVRPWLGSKISVGQFKIKKDITLVDCSVLHAKKFVFYLKEPTAEKKEEAVWSDIDWAFSNPVTANDSIADYIPTQIIAELFKNNGLDGIAYKSNLGKGHNVVLFDIIIADIANCFLYETDKINFSFKEAASPYFIKKKNKQNTTRASRETG